MDKTTMNDNIDKREKEIIRTWLAGNHSCTLVVPKDFAVEYKLDKPSHVIIEKRREGLLIRRLEI
jgi:hypothetical protein